MELSLILKILVALIIVILGYAIANNIYYKDYLNILERFNAS